MKLRTALRVARHPLPLAAGLVCLCLLAAFTWAMAWSLVTLKALQNHQVAAAAPAARRALPIAQAASWLTAGRQPDIVVWRDSLTLIAVSDSLWPQMTQSLELKPDQDTLPLGDLLAPHWTTFERLVATLPQTWVIKRFLSDQQLRQLAQLTEWLPILKTEWLTGTHTWLVVFQNSQELRPTGGFMGSLAFVTLTEGSLAKIEVQDMYQPAGQLQTYLEPPAGVAEFLSEGRGWQMTDANWSPEFPQSAHTLLQMLQAAHYPPIDGVVAVNDDLAQGLLDIVGPQTLPDYDVTVTAENMPSILRSNRESFFPGSIGKQHLLSSFFTQMKSALLHLSPTDQVRVLQELKAQTTQKNLQLYAVSPGLQRLFIDQKLSPVLQPSSDSGDLYFSLNEANVGINKANQRVTRQLALDIGQDKTQATITLTNANAASNRPVLSPTAVGADHLHYVTYLRVYVLPSTQLLEAYQDQEKLTPRQQKLITTVTGQQLQEISFLVVVNEMTQKVITMSFSHLPLTTADHLVVQKQSGIPPLPLQLTWKGQTAAMEIDQDLNYSLP